MEEKVISPINLPTLPLIDEKALESDRNRAIADSRSKRTRSHVSMFDSFIETSSVSTSNSDTNRNIVVHEFVPDGTEPDQGKNASPSITTNISTNKRKDKETQTLKVSTATRSKIEHISDVYASFNLPKSTRSCIPTIKDLRNEEVLNEINANKWRGLINMSQKCLDQTLRAICPGPSRTQLKLDLVKDVQRKEKVSNSKHKTETDFEKINNKIMHALFTMLKNSKNASIEKRVIRAIVAKTLKKGMIQEKCNTYGIMDITSGSIVHKINEDFQSLMNGIPIEKKVQTRRKISDAVITNVVSYILQKDHITTTSWGEKEFNLNKHETIILPKLCRKMSQMNLWKSYISTYEATKCVGRTTFYYLVKDLTSSNRDIVTSVDYVQALLVTEPVEILQQVVNSLVHTTEKELLTQYITAASTFLKSRYQKHVLKSNDDCVTHDLKFVLGRYSTYDDSARTCEKDKITCPQCMFPYFVCDKIKECITTTSTTNIPTTSESGITEQISDAISVIKECQRKFRLYMAHKARCTNQNHAIEEIHQNMKKMCIDSNGKQIVALMIGDYKMKFEPMSQRETTLDHYGKRGISWHGFCLQFYLLKSEKSDDGEDVKVTSKYTVYLDQVVSDGNKQDALSVYSLLDAALGQVSNEMPFVSSIILQTDNAKSYNNTFLLCAIPLLNITYQQDGLSITEFIHTETQDGKTILDAHFARMMKFVRQFMSSCDDNEVKKINTPGTLGYALSHNGGVKNVGVQVVNTNNAVTRNIEEKFVAVTKVLKTYFTRVNHAYFYPPDKATTEGESYSSDMSACDIIDTMLFNIGVQSYSNINRIVNFHIDMTKSGKNMVTPDKLLLDEVNKKQIMNENDTTQTIDLADIECDELHQVAASLLEMQLHSNIDAENEESSQRSENMFDHTIFSTDDTSDTSSDVSSYVTEDEIESDSEKDEDLDNNFYNVEDMLNSRVFDTPNQDIYNKDNFLTKVNIEMILSIGKLSSFNKPKMHRREKINFSTIHQQDARTQAIRIANELIQHGDLGIISASNDDPILEDCESFDATFDHLHFEQGWGRRNNTSSESTLYGDTYIAKYKDKLSEFFEQGRTDSSKKMNAAMMREQLQKEFPNTFSLPGETEIKKYISLLFSKSKGEKNRNVVSQQDDNCDTTELDEDVTNSEQNERKSVLQTIIIEHHREKPAFIYELFIKVMVKDRGFDLNDLPSKKFVKTKISSTKTSIKRKLQQSIV